MTLTLRAVELNGQRMAQPITGQFDSSGGTIGRTEQNTLVLPDPDRHISRHQATISVTPSGYVIRNMGAANPLTVRGRVLGHGDAATLSQGDLLLIGGYRLMVLDANADDSAAHAVTRPFQISEFSAAASASITGSVPLDPFTLIAPDRSPSTIPGALTRSPTAGVLDGDWCDGVRSAVARALARFEPSAVESRLATESVPPGGAPTSADLNVWALYRLNFDLLRSEAFRDVEAALALSAASARPARDATLDAPPAATPGVSPYSPSAPPTSVGSGAGSGVI